VHLFMSYWGGDNQDRNIIHKRITENIDMIASDDIVWMYIQSINSYIA
jgi:hypothetical protein